MNILVSIMAHREAQSTFDRHLPHWKTMSPNLQVWCPEGHCVRTNGIPVIELGKPEHHGVIAMKRFKYMIQWLAESEYDLHAFYEYDSFSLEPKFPDLPYDALAGNWFDNTHIGQEFKGEHFVHPPLFADRSTLLLLAEALSMMRNDEELGFWDRFVGLACKKAGIRRMDLFKFKLGWSANTVHPGLYPHLRNAVRDGAIHLHGIKGENAYNLAVKTHKEK